MLKSDLLGPILSTSGPKARKCQNRSSWDPFCRLLEPRPENAKIGPPGTQHPSEARVMKTLIETFQFMFGVDAGIIVFLKSPGGFVVSIKAPKPKSKMQHT